MKNLCFSVALFCSALCANAQMKLGNNPTTIDASAILQLDAITGGTKQGLLLPRVSLTSTSAFAPLASHVAGMIVYNTATVSDVTPGYYYDNGSKWVQLAGQTNTWSLTGNAGTSSALNFLGTTDNHPLVFKVNNLRAGYVDSLGGLGNTAFGYSAGTNVTTGANNISIGKNAQVYSATGSNQLTIGNLIYADTTARVGINIPLPQATLDILGNKSGNVSIVNGVDSINTFLQYNVTNNSLGTQAQSGYSATANNGTNTSNFTWMGINNSNFNFPTTYNIGGADDVSFLGSGNDMYVANANQTKSIIFSTGTSTTPFFTERMRILNGGNVGIGTNAPGVKLDVNGEGRFVSPNVGSTGGVTIEDAASNPDAAYLQFVNNGATTQYAAIKGLKASSLAFYAGSNEGMRILSNGNVGIGTTTPTFPLQISSTVNYNLIGNYGYLNSTTPTGLLLATGTVPFSVYASGRMASTEFDAYSDERIKENVQTLQSSSSAEILDRLRPVSFEYIDKPAKGAGLRLGFIAQEVEKWVPSAVNRNTDFIPNIFKLISDGSATIPCDTKGIKEGDDIKVITADGEKIVKVKKVHDGSMDLASGNGPNAERSTAGNSIMLDWANPDQNFLVYGTKVNDLRTVEYDQLVTLCISSVQELNRKIENQQQSLVEQFKKMTRQERRQLRKMLK